MKKYWLLNEKLNSGDLDLLNSTSIETVIMELGWGVKTPTTVSEVDSHREDSGWCDGSTNCRIVTGDTRVAFVVDTPADHLLLTLKYHDRLTQINT